MDARAVLVLVAGCFSPHPPAGIACAKEGVCPAPLMCSSGICVTQQVADAAGDGPACTAIATASGTLTVPRLAHAIAIDGDLADWSTCFVSVDPMSAGLVRDLGAGGRFASGRFSLAADANHLYVAAEVNSVPPLGDQPLPAVYLNNAISVYFDADGVFGETRYDADAAQIVVDHANREQAFRNGSTVTAPGVTSAATTSATTFTIEMAVTPATFGATAFGSTIGFDIGLVGGDGQVMTSELVWFQACKPPQCGCTNGDAAPYCDAREFGTVTFAP